MDKELIIQNEIENDGKTIHLYFNREVGLYVAYGFSAFFASHIITIIPSFSEDMEMPVALMRKSDVEELKPAIARVSLQNQQYYQLELRKEIMLDDYVRWANSLKLL